MFPNNVKKYITRQLPCSINDEETLKVYQKFKNLYGQEYVNQFIWTKQEAEKILVEMNINKNSSFYELYLHTFDDTDNIVADTLYGLNEIYEDYKTPFWGEQYPNIQDRYLRISSIEGEHSYFYDKETDAVYSVDWNQMDDLVSGKLKPQWKSFYDFLEWYYGEDEEE